MVNPVAQALQQPISPFFWGRGGAKLTPEQIAREREIAEALGVVDTSPVDHWLQGAARMANAAVGRLRESRADRAEQENASFNADIVQSLLGSIGGPTVLTPSGTSPVPATSPTASSEPMDYASARVASAHGDPVAWRNAIASIESAGSGDYQAVGPRHPRLGRALGRYQVMEANVGPWTEKYLGRRLTPEEFLASPEAQDAVFDGEFGSYVQRFGDPALAAQAWFAGPGGVGTNRQDSLGTSVPEYARRFQKVLDQNPQGTQRALESLPVGGSMTMPPAQAPIQVAQAGGGINPAIIEALSSPYVNDQTRQIAGLLLQQQMQEQQSAQAQQMRMLAVQQAGIDPRFAGDDEIWKAAVGQQFRDPTTDIQEYEYARNQGFTGSFTEFQEAKRRAGAINVDARTMGNIPPGYHVEYDEAGNPVRMMPVPGGPAWQEQQEAESAAEAARRNAASYARTVTQDIGIADDYLSQIGDFAGGDGIVGANIRAYRSGIPGTPEYNMRQFVESALNNVTLDTMNRMRESSPAGATGFGNMSERQMEVIRGVLGQWKPGLPIDDQRYILHRLGNFYLDVQFGTEQERQEAVRDGRMSQVENEAIQELYYPETRDIRGRRTGANKPLSEMTDEELEAIINGDR